MRSLYQYGYDKAKARFLGESAPSDDLLQNDGRTANPLRGNERLD